MEHLHCNYARDFRTTIYEIGQREEETEAWKRLILLKLLLKSLAVASCNKALYTKLLTLVR